MRLLKKLLLALSIIFAIRVYAGSYDPIATDLLRSKFKEYKVPCEFFELNIVPPLALRLNGLSCEILKPKSAPLGTNMAFNTVDLSPAWKELILFRPGVKVSIVPLGETSNGLSLTLSRSISSGKSHTTLNFNKFPVGSILKSGLIPNMSIEGELNGELNLSFTSKEDLVGEGNVMFEKGVLSASGMEQSIIKLPALRELSINLPILSDAKSVTISPITGSATFGVLKGEASVKNLSTLPTYSFNGSLLLNDLGMKTVGGFVALAAGTDISKPVEEWKISATGNLLDRPIVKITPEDSVKKQKRSS